MYLTYAKFREYGGTLDETTFNSYEFEAETVVDWYTFNRLQKDATLSEVNQEKLNRCMYALIEIIKSQHDMITASADASDTTTGKVIASQSNDGVSVSYNVLNSTELSELLKQKSANIVQRYLNGVTNSLGRKLLYRGLYPNE